MPAACWSGPTVSSPVLKVAFITFDYTEYCVPLVNSLSSLAHVQFLLPTTEAAPQLRRLDEAVKLRPFVQARLREPIRQIRTLAYIYGQVRRFDPDVVHLQQGHLWFNFALPLLRRYPVVLTIHDPRQHVGDDLSAKTPQWVLNFGYRQANQVIVHVAGLKEAAVALTGLPADQIHVIPHGQIVHPDDIPEDDRTPEDENLILFFGRIWEYKGLEYLIRAEPLISARVPGTRIVIAGQGEDFARYRRMMLNPDRFVVHNEYVSSEKRTELFRRASVVVLPYVDATQSGVVPVAYAFAKPVVASAVGGLPDAVEHGRTGYLVPPRDEAALADAVVRLLRDGELRRRMGANGRRKLHAEWSPAGIAERTLAVYRQAVNRGRPRDGESPGSRTRSADQRGSSWPLAGGGDPSAPESCKE